MEKPTRSRDPENRERRSGDRPPRKSGESGFERLGKFSQYAIAIGMLISSTLSALAALFSSSTALMLLAAGLLLCTGVVHLALVDFRADRRYTRHPRLKRLAEADRRFAWRWIGTGALLGLLVLLLPCTFLTGAVGAALTFVTYLNGVVIGANVVAAENDVFGSPARRKGCARRTAPLPGTEGAARLFGRRRPLGWITRALAWTMLVVALAGIFFLGVSIASLLSGGRSQDGGKGAGHGRSHKEDGEGSGGSGASGAAPTEPEDPSWRELCPDRPNPLSIGYGLGELFRREGAVKAGCGEPAWAVGGAAGMHVAEGICAGDLRSLAIVSPESSPVLVYDEAALFIKEAAEDEELLFVEAAYAGSGEVVVAGTTSGNHTFARSSPSIRRPDENARNCSELAGLSRPFVQLIPAMGYLWLGHIEEFGWAWPVERDTDEAGEIIFIGHETGVEIANGRCLGNVCELDGPGAPSSYPGISFVELSMLVPFMPPSEA